jgi:hypothetical protein
MVNVIPFHAQLLKELSIRSNFWTLISSLSKDVLIEKRMGRYLPEIKPNLLLIKFKRFLSILYRTKFNSIISPSDENITGWAKSQKVKRIYLLQFQLRFFC